MPEPSLQQLPEQFGRYRILQLLGRGGMGSVYLAEDTDLERRVALKIPLLSDDNRTQQLERFYREARAAATLHHPNICPVHDIGEVGGLPFLTMAFIEGRTLAQYVARKPLTQGQANTLVRKLALALKEAHQVGVIHRDLKPANIMIDRRGEPIIMDFGLARRTDPREARLTQSGMVIGTPAYMPPEQISASSDSAGPSCDVYSLGVIHYELLTGQLPFTGDVLGVLARILTEPPPPPSSVNPEVSPQLEAICLKALAKRPQDRFASMAEYATVLRDYLRGEETASKTAVVQPAASPVEEPAGQAPGFRATYMGGLRSLALMPGRKPGEDRTEPQRPGPKRRRKRQRQRTWAWLPWVVAMASVGAVGIGGWLLSQKLSPAAPGSQGRTVAAVPVEQAGATPAPAPPQAPEAADTPQPKTSVPGAKAPAEPFVRLFNGKDLSGWKTHPSQPGGWEVSGGLLTGRSGSYHHLFSDRGDYEDFHLRAEVRTSPMGNSGIYFRTSFALGRGPFPADGYEAQILDRYPRPNVPLTGSLGRLHTVTNHLVDENGWTLLEVLARGNRILIKVNDKVATDYTDEANAFRKGHLALQAMTDQVVGRETTVEFRKIEIREFASGVAE